MASDRQIAANRANARLSTGPTSPEGKAVSRANALVHGLAGAGTVLPAGVEAKVAERVASWGPHYRVENPIDAWRLEQVAYESVRIERCQAEERLVSGAIAERAGDAWEGDRTGEVEAVARRLARSPEATKARLDATLRGAEWLLARWILLDGVLERGGDWSEPQRTLALDLLGLPLVFREGVTEVDLAPIAGQPATRDELTAHRRAIADRERSRLMALCDGPLGRIDAVDRELAGVGLAVMGHPTIDRIRRYEGAAHRRMETLTRGLAPRRVADSRPAIATNAAARPAAPPVARAPVADPSPAKVAADPPLAAVNPDDWPLPAGVTDRVAHYAELDATTARWRALANA